MDTIITEKMDDGWEVTNGASSQNAFSQNGLPQLRVVLLGKTGDGKSATGNTVLGRQEFSSTVSAESVTTFCRLGAVDRFGKQIRIVDTPGFFDTRMSNNATRKEIVKCIAMSAPGPHAFIIIIRPDRFTQEVRDTMKLIKETFGKEVMRYMAVVFTRKDDLDYAEKTVEDFIRGSPQPLKMVIQEVENQYTAINNRCSKAERDKEAKIFVELVERIVERNDGKCYTHELFQQAERELQQEEQKRRQALENERQHAIDSIRKEVEARGEQREEEYQNRIAELEREMEGRLKSVREDVVRDVQEERGGGAEIIGRLVSTLLQKVMTKVQDCTIM